MWRYILVSCTCNLNVTRKIGIFVHENKVYDVNICDFGNGSVECNKCVASYYKLLKDHPELLSETRDSKNPLRLE